MLTQWALIGSFALNLLIVWLTVVTQKFTWYSRLAVPIGVAIVIIMPVLNQLRFPDFMMWKMIGTLLALAGITLIAIARYQLVKAGDNPLDLPQHLVSVGIYKHIRHPLYLGLVFFFVGWCWVWAAVYSFYFGLVIIVLIWFQAYLEEKMILEKKFGQQYREYRKHAGMFWIK